MVNVFLPLYFSQTIIELKNRDDHYAYPHVHRRISGTMNDARKEKTLVKTSAMTWLGGARVTARARTDRESRW
ncbi:Uncharacterized protein APZ42_019563 [Daphnia magna]|uniref:Uncharacterized protein n=1 Tax=Daphnia magna TaxID=35525 RepID=A0A164Y9D9_9CRUS|nr:Uncharacterized protein APZ42_019563 [Daphnia magna]